MKNALAYLHKEGTGINKDVGSVGVVKKYYLPIQEPRGLQTFFRCPVA